MGYKVEVGRKYESDARAGNVAVSLDPANGVGIDRASVAVALGDAVTGDFSRQPFGTEPSFLPQLPEGACGVGVDECHRSGSVRDFPGWLPVIPSKPDLSREVKDQSGTSGTVRVYRAPVVDESERLLQISLRLKAARLLAGEISSKGAVGISVRELAELGPLKDERITANKLEEAEQRKTSLRRSDLRAIIEALSLPPDWFDGLYPSDKGQAPNGSLGAALQAVAEGARELRKGREDAAGQADGRGRRRRASGAGDE